MAGANFEDSAIFRIWGEEVEFEPDREFARGLRYSEHPNGDLVTIYYVTEQQWSRKRREAPVGDDGSKIQDRMIQATKELFPSGRFVWHGNKSLVDDPFGSPAERLPNKPHGLNSFARFDDIVFLSSLNPTTDHFGFLQSRGLSGGEVRGFTYFAEAYQAIMRTSLRDPGNRQPKRILVPDRGLAEYLQDAFPGSRVEKMALEMRGAIGVLTEKWRQLGHEIDFGIGIAHGYATLGTIGFEGRFDYAAIGTVSNVASRLCDEAKPGQILISPRVLIAVKDAVTVESVGEFELKGIRRPIAAYNVLATTPKI